MASTGLSRTCTAGNDQKGTLSFWCKKSENAREQYIVGFGEVAGDYTQLSFMSSDSFMASSLISGSAGNISVNAYNKNRDPSAWYHFVVGIDSTQVTATDRVKYYINGVQTVDADLDNNTYPTQDAAMPFNKVGQLCTVGMHDASGGFFNGNMAHVHWIDGTQYAASDFGETDATSGIWIPKLGPSVTYGTNGFFLKFAAGAFGTDSSGEGNTMAVTGTMTATKDDPENNFATMNPLVYGTSQTYSNGNNTITNSGATWEQTFATQGVSAGKWYWEAKFVSGTWVVTGVDSVIFYSPSTSGFTTTSVGYKSNNGNVAVAASIIDTEATYAPGDIISVALDMDNDAVYFAKDGVWINSGDPTSGASKTGAYTLPVANTTYFPTMGLYNTEVDSLNFGNGYFGTTVVASTNADDAGYGDFEYDVPTGFYALCTKNIGTYG